MDAPLQILIVDDEPIVGKRLKQALSKLCVEVEVFDDSRKALYRLKEKKFDIVVTDVRMDKIDGIQILEYVKKRFYRTKVIIITGNATVDLVRETVYKGAFDFIAKPFKPNDLRRIIKKAALDLGHRNIAGIEIK